VGFDAVNLHRPTLSPGLGLLARDERPRCTACIFVAAACSSLQWHQIKMKALFKSSLPYFIFKR
jgi:hypothetical protein